MSKKSVLIAAQLAVLSAACSGGSFLPYNHYHDHEYRDRMKTRCKGMSAEEMGTAHSKKKPRSHRRRK